MNHMALGREETNILSEESIFLINHEIYILLKVSHR